MNFNVDFDLSNENFNVEFSGDHDLKTNFGEVVEVITDPYMGEYTVTPSSQTQTLQTRRKNLAENITVNPIPQNYGLITWNGSFLTVS